MTSLSAPSSVPDTDVTPVTEPTDASTLSIVIVDASPELDAADITVAVVDPATDEPLATAPCRSFAACVSFDLTPGRYRLEFTIDDPPELAYFLIDDDLADGETGLAFAVDLTDGDVERRFGLGAVAAPPPPPQPPTTRVPTTVSSGGPVPVSELPATGNDARIALAAAVLLAAGFGCSVLARRRPT